MFEDDDDVFITVDHKSAKNSEPDLPADEYAKSTKIKYVYRPLGMGLQYNMFKTS